MRRNNAELEHEAAPRPSAPPPPVGRNTCQREESTMTALIRVDAQPGRERPLVVAWLAVLVALSWACLVFQALHISTVEPSMPPSYGVVPAPYRAPEVLLVLGMWGAMLAAMMLPASTPTILLFSRINRLVHAVRHPNLATLLFVIGYLAVWGGFGACATLAQWVLHDAGALDTGMALVNPNACGLMLVAAGVYQWTPAKHACLQHCRAPLSFFLTGWQPGLAGALRMGCGHGLYCSGCCWLLMALLFVAVVNNLAVLLGLAGLVLAEKLLPGGAVMACIGGLALVAWGTLLLFP